MAQDKDAIDILVTYVGAKISEERRKWY